MLLSLCLDFWPLMHALLLQLPPFHSPPSSSSSKWSETAEDAKFNTRMIMMTVDSKSLAAGQSGFFPHNLVVHISTHRRRQSAAVLRISFSSGQQSPVCRRKLHTWPQRRRRISGAVPKTGRYFFLQRRFGLRAIVVTAHTHQLLSFKPDFLPYSPPPPSLTSRRLRPP